MSDVEVVPIDGTSGMGGTGGLGGMGGMRLVATDLDGTVVRPDGSISARTLRVFEACVAAGIHVVYVTGRPPRWLGEVVAQTGHRGTAICGNGAIVYDLDDEQVRHARTLAPADVLEVVRRLRTAIPGTSFALETLLGFRREGCYVARYDADLEQLTGPVDELLRDDPGVVKLLCRNESSHGDAMLAVARPALDGLAHVTHSNPRDCLIEVSAPGVSKAAALAELAHERGVAQADVVAFGDMPNDIEMLAWAGRGYAMADGHPEALAAADQVAPPCAEDGVAQVIEQLLRAASVKTSRQ